MRRRRVGIKDLTREEERDREKELCKSAIAEKRLCRLGLELGILKLADTSFKIKE